MSGTYREGPSPLVAAAAGRARRAGVASPRSQLSAGLLLLLALLFALSTPHPAAAQQQAPLKGSGVPHNDTTNSEHSSLHLSACGWQFLSQPPHPTCATRLPTSPAVFVSVMLERLLGVNAVEYSHTTMLYYYITWVDPRAHAIQHEMTMAMRNGSE